MEITSPSTWYILKTIGGKEKKVKEYIESEIQILDLTSKLGQLLIPVEKIVTQKGGKRQEKEKILYNGYLFVEILSTEKKEVTELFHTLKNTPNAIGFITSPSGKPEPVNALEMRRILGMVDELSQRVAISGEAFVVGDNVKVTDGPFNDMTAVVEEVNNDKHKLKVSVKIFGRKTPLELSFSQVVKM